MQSVTALSCPMSFLEANGRQVMTSEASSAQEQLVGAHELMKRVLWKSCHRILPIGVAAWRRGGSRPSG